MKTLTDLEKRKQQLLDELENIDDEIKNNHNTNINNIENEIKKRVRIIKKELPEFKINYDIMYDVTYLDLEISFKDINDTDKDINLEKLIITDVETIDDLKLLDNFVKQIPKIKYLLKLIKTSNGKHYKYCKISNYNNLTLQLEKWHYNNGDTRKRIQAEISNINDDTCELSISIGLELNNYTIFNYKISDNNFNYSVEFEITTEGYDSPEVNRTYKTEFDEVKINDVFDIISQFENTVDKNDILNKLKQYNMIGE